MEKGGIDGRSEERLEDAQADEPLEAQIGLFQPQEEIPRRGAVPPGEDMEVVKELQGVSKVSRCHLVRHEGEEGLGPEEEGP